MKRHSRPCPSVPVFIGALIMFSVLASLARKMLRTTSHPVPFVHTTLNDSQSLSNITSEQGGSLEVDPELDALRHIVSQTKGFYARDYSLWLGWNNVRPRFISELRKSWLAPDRCDTSSRQRSSTDVSSTVLQLYHLTCTLVPVNSTSTCYSCIDLHILIFFQLRMRCICYHGQ